MVWENTTLIGSNCNYVIILTTPLWLREQFSGRTLGSLIMVNESEVRREGEGEGKGDGKGKGEKEKGRGRDES